MADDASHNGSDGRDWGDSRRGESERPSGSTPTEWGEDRSDGDQIPIDLSGGREPPAGTGTDEDPADDAGDGYAPEPSSAPVEPGKPTLEHAVFVLLGAVAMVFVVVRVVTLLG